MIYLNGPTPASHPSFEPDRVLEIGCGVGANAGAIKEKFPGAEVQAFDIDPKQIEIARQNHPDVAFFVHDLTKPVRAGRFDYVLAHGILSWVPDPSALICQFEECLAADGIGFISYDVLPGCACKGALREVLLQHLEHFPEERHEEQAKALLALLSRQDTSLGRLAASLLDQPWWYIRHDHLETDYNPIWFSDFLAMLDDYGLEYVGDAQPHSSEPDDEETRNLFRSLFSAPRIEIYTDWVRDRTFRQSLIRKRR
jgi:SAM-dependent methyltransferase